MAAAAPGGDGGHRVLLRFQAEYTTVIETVSCCVPGEIGTDAAPLAAELNGSGSGVVVDCCTGVTLITGPSGSPSAAAYWLACALASATARALAAAISLPVSVRFSDTSLTLTALPPARTAA